ncbi:hypothetical protein [Kibdelosporangium phytohabitans]|uniref:hypothetical protein n=1 Tax=Kibdelosporangium phytohabitans TaxID=860235 RepID=UPI0012FCCAF1|nr:hypothetical protein [Kibdelosporangium phytohabitans]MBE1469877.1 hypothetical protein [Kibdelosporangium phytohabitans]
MPEAARRRSTALIITGMVLGGAGMLAYFVLSAPGSASPAPPPAGSEGSATPEGVARAIVTKLNARDLDGVIELTCAQGKSTGRRELVKAVPQLDPAAPESTRAKQIEFGLDHLSQFAEGYIATFTVQYQGAKQNGTMRIQLSADKWTLCGLDSPRLDGVG